MMNVANSTTAPAFSADNLNLGDHFLQPENGNPKYKKKRRCAKIKTRKLKS